MKTFLKYLWSNKTLVITWIVSILLGVVIADFIGDVRDRQHYLNMCSALLYQLEDLIGNLEKNGKNEHDIMEICLQMEALQSYQCAGNEYVDGIVSGGGLISGSFHYMRIALKSGVTMNGGEAGERLTERGSLNQSEIQFLDELRENLLTLADGLKAQEKRGIFISTREVNWLFSDFESKYMMANHSVYVWQILNNL